MGWFSPVIEPSPCMALAIESMQPIRIMLSQIGNRGQARTGIEAPDHVDIRREELVEEQGGSAEPIAGAALCIEEFDVGSDECLETFLQGFQFLVLIGILQIERCVLEKVADIGGDGLRVAGPHLAGSSFLETIDDVFSDSDEFVEFFHIL